MPGLSFCLVEAVVVVLALGVGGLLVCKSLNRDDRSPADWPPAAPARELALARHPDGSWRPAATKPDDSTLTVTLVVPWDEVGDRYSSLNVVVK